MREIERVIILRVVDTKWMDHIDDMDHLKTRYWIKSLQTTRSNSSLPNGR